jgi:hypothetical protein
MLRAFVFTLSKLPVTAAATLLTLASLNNNTTKETVLVDAALPKETKRINVKVNIMHFCCLNLCLHLQKCLKMQQRHYLPWLP